MTETNTTDVLVTLEDVSKSYKGVELYSGASAQIPTGEISAIVGPNGSGKSVLLRLLCGFVEPDSGTVSIAEKYLSPGHEFPEKYGVIIDRPAFLPGATGFANLKDLADIRGEITVEQIAETMLKFGLKPDNKTKVSRYSLGMKQKLALCQAVMEGQEVLVLDEPFNALDRKAVEALRSMLVDHRKAGGTVVFTSHNPEDIQLLAENVFHIEDGRLIHERGSADLLQ